MEKTYNPASIEEKWYQQWENQGYFASKVKSEPYCIMIPPPNVTGTLHMGHGFQNTLMDALIRYHRMCGLDTHWQMGTDHAGIATQMVVERRLLRNEKLTRHDLGRDEFIKRVWEWKAESGNTISQQLRRLGCSMDWEKERFTMDETLSHAVHEVFIRLHNEGLIYRGKRLVNWDPTLLTAISDLEVESTEEEGSLWHMRYPLKNSDEFIIVATTRPETMLGDVAVAVHPDDERYKHLIGKMVCLPLTDREIPIIADEYVDPLFGSGCVKITPAHDMNDYEIGKRHELPMINILNPNATINENAPSAYQSLDRFKAREKVIEDLNSLELLEKIEPHKLKIPRGDRSGDVIEPYLTDQWYVNTTPLAEMAIDAVKSEKIKFIPENWSKTYYQWMENIEDWCISRQLWWGHRIPAWYDEDGQVYVARSEKDVRAKYKLADDIVLRQDEDVLDTWFSSALWPFATLGWPKQTPDFKRYYPTNVLVTGFDIIFFWVARMIMMGEKFTGQAPFSEVYITGLIRDRDGQKMSKSKGNVLDPIDLIDGIGLEELVEKRTTGLMQPKYAKKIEKQTRDEFPEGIPAFGTDALRFTYCALATMGRDIRFDIGRLSGYQNFCNKLWNAARYVMMNTENEDVGEHGDSLSFSIADQWIQSRLQTVIAATHQHFKDYRFDYLASALYDFVWHEYCDWYLELSKPVLYGEGNAAVKRGTRYTLLTVLESILCLLHPLMPFITEEIWQKVAPLIGKNNETIMLESYPAIDHNKIDEEIEADIAWLQEVIVGIRTIRAEMNIAPSKAVPVIFHKGSHADKERLQHTNHLLSKLAKCASITWHELGSDLPMAATALVGEMEILIPMKGLIDKEAELARLQREISKLEKESMVAEKKLANPGFVKGAPEAVVEKEKQHLSEVVSALEKLTGQREKIAAL